ncbi:hypothetical protein ACJIZ3_016101 [Penstemon smallii]|uniref:Uncharacterized protein n=1 Tax=Penstemon smallii TaxID=265156 RepID=A0ABD3RPL0_9LAMI
MTSKEEDSKKKPQPQLVKLNRAFKVAEQWVNNMSNSSVIDKSTAVDLEGRPSRLGIGATVPKQSSFALSNDPVERKLLAKLQSHQRNVTKKAEDLTSSAKDGDIDEDSDEEESESKAKAFSKKRPPSVKSFVHAKKKAR